MAEVSIFTLDTTPGQSFTKQRTADDAAVSSSEGSEVATPPQQEGPSARGQGARQGGADVPNASIELSRRAVPVILRACWRPVTLACKGMLSATPANDFCSALSFRARAVCAKLLPMFSPCSKSSKILTSVPYAWTNSLLKTRATRRCAGK
jgi:hypothetical protein